MKNNPPEIKWIVFLWHFLALFTTIQNLHTFYKMFPYNNSKKYKILETMGDLLWEKE